MHIVYYRDPTRVKTFHITRSQESVSCRTSCHTSIQPHRRNSVPYVQIQPPRTHPSRVRPAAPWPSSGRRPRAELMTVNADYASKEQSMQFFFSVIMGSVPGKIHPERSRPAAAWAQQTSLSSCVARRVPLVPPVRALGVRPPPIASFEADPGGGCTVHHVHTGLIRPGCRHESFFYPEPSLSSSSQNRRLEASQRLRQSRHTVV